jgi:hypothetical protein
VTERTTRLPSCASGHRSTRPRASSALSVAPIDCGLICSSLASAPGVAGRRVLQDKRDARTQQLAQALSAGFTRDELGLLMAAAPLLERLAQRI